MQPPPGLAAPPKGIEAETFKQLSRENMPPMPPPGGRGPRGGPPGAFGADDRWQSGRMPAGARCWLGRDERAASAAEPVGLAAM